MGVKNITEAEYNDAIKTGKVIVDFWATWCGPCKMQGALIEEKLLPAHPEIEVLKVNVDEEPALAAKFGIMSIPTLLLYKDGKFVEQLVGLTKPDELAAKLA
ncbi:MAG: thioredoxin [Kiritimatiellae bacterium]|nr:thioredoxin [Kiritimatiellia bacterium]